MPKAAKHPCPYPGCGVLVDYGKRYCPTHQAQADAQKQERASVYDKTRTEAKFYHSSRWQKLRNWFIKNNPLCVQCLREGRVTTATVVDHIEEIKDGGARYDINNLQSLCHACHNDKTAHERKKRKK